jgi:chitodextrinase
MADVTRAFFFPADEQAVCRAVAQGLGGIHELMFSRDYGVPARPDQMRVSWGKIDENSPMLAGKAALTEALAGSGVAQATIDRFVELADITEADAEQRARELDAELSATVSAIDWVEPTGSEDAIEKGAIRKHNGKTWVSLQDANVFEPGVASWRVVWSTATDTPPAWVQPTGATDAYRTGERVSHNGTTWHTLRDFNTREPGTFDAGWIDEGAVVGDEWAEGVAYSVGDEVTFEGSTYRCIQAHTSISVWTPPVVPALWELIEE